MRISVPALTLLMVLSGCGSTAALRPTGLPATATADLSAASTPSTAGWEVYGARYGGGDGEGMIWLDLYDPEFATHSVFVSFTDIGDTGLSQDPFRYATVDSKTVPPGSIGFKALQAELAGAYVPFGVDPRVVQGASTILAHAATPAG